MLPLPLFYGLQFQITSQIRLTVSYCFDFLVQKIPTVDYLPIIMDLTPMLAVDVDSILNFTDEVVA